MPKGSVKLTNARKEEIIDACASLYETMSFRDITLRDISARTSFTRTSIYNYFQTKEEIFLGLLQREYEAWTADLDALLSRSRPAAGDFACELSNFRLVADSERVDIRGLPEPLPRFCAGKLRVPALGFFLFAEY